MRRGLFWAGLALSAPCVLLLVALPVGFVMELGKQTRLRVVNRTGRPLRVTPLRYAEGGPDRFDLVAPTLHPLVPLPAFRAAEHPVAPGATLVLHHRARRGNFLLAVRDADGALAVAGLSPEAAGPDLPSGREILLQPSTVFGPASPGMAAAVSARPQVLGWTLLLAAPLGTFAFVRLLRARRNGGVSGFPLPGPRPTE